MYGLALGTTMIFIGAIILTGEFKPATADSKVYSLPFLPIVIGLLTLSTIGYLVCLIIIAVRKKYTFAVLAFIVYMVVALTFAALTGSARSETTHWLAQSMGAMSNAMLIYGCWTLYKGEVVNIT